MGLGPIPRSAIYSYAAEHGLSGDEAEQFAQIIRTVDQEYLTLANQPGGRETANLVSAHDAEGMRGLFSRLQARAAGATKQHVKPAKPTNGNA